MSQITKKTPYDKVREFRLKNLDKREELFMFLGSHDWSCFKEFIGRIFDFPEDAQHIKYMGVNVCLKKVDGIYN